MSSAQEHTVETAAPTAADIAHSNTLMSAEELAAMNDTGDEAELLAKVAGDDDEADETGDDDDAADDGAAPIEESAAKPAEDKPAEKAAEKPAATSESTDDEDEAVAPVFAFKLPDDFDAQVNANKQALADLRKQRDDGDIDLAEYDAQAEKLLEQRDDLRRMRDKADIAAEAQKTADQQRVDRAVKDAFRAALADGVDYKADKEKAGDLDGFIKALANNPANDDKPLKWFFAEAHRRVLALHGITAGKPAPTPKPAEKATKGPRHPDLSAVPKTLAGVPGSDGPGDLDGDEFSELDKLEGEAYDEAYAKLSKAQQERYLAASSRG
jgi:hypothetical protein